MELGKLKFVQAGIEYLNDCSEILKNSELGQKYFADATRTYIGKSLLKEGFEKNEIYISLKKEPGVEVIGFSWIQEKGIFNWFPFLHVVIISESQRGKGYGKIHMEHFELMCRKTFKIDKGFLMVGQYNSQAMHLYENMGYMVVGDIPNLFIRGISETLMYKDMSKKHNY